MLEGHKDSYDCLPPLNNIDTYRWIIGLFFTIWNSTALGFLLLIEIIFFRLMKQLNTPIYRLINCMHISQLLYMFPYFVTMLPCTYVECSFYSRTLNIWLSWPHTFGYYAGITFNCLIAFERISIFLCKWFHNFVEMHTLFYILIGWFAGVLVTVISTAIGCCKT